MSTNTREVNERVYFSPHGRVAHLLPLGHYANDKRSALCGRGPLGAAWFGTGSQDEYETAEGMPTCTACAREVGE